MPHHKQESREALPGMNGEPMVLLRELHEGKEPDQAWEGLRRGQKQTGEKCGLSENFNEEQPCVCLQLICTGIDSYENQTTMTRVKTRKRSAEQSVCCRSFHGSKLAVFKKLNFLSGTQGNNF